jgi:hypothetical protein
VEIKTLDVAAYRGAVSDLISDVGAGSRPRDPVKVKSLVTERLTEPEFAQLLAVTPGGPGQVAGLVRAEISQFRPGNSASPSDVAELVRICLLAQIDAVWWGAVPAYQRDRDVYRSADLVDLADRAVGFRYRCQTDALAPRAVRAVERRIMPGRTPDPVGLRFARTRPEVVRLLDELATELARSAPAGTPPLWVTSLARSVQHQRRLRSLGYAAMLPSSHCTGYGTDIAMSWYRRYAADGILSQLLLERCEAGQINVIYGGQTWHVCLSPSGAQELRRDAARRIGG